MNRALLRKAAKQSVALMITVVVLSYSLNNYHTIVKAASFLIGSDMVTDVAVSNKSSTDAGSNGKALTASSNTNSLSSLADLPITDASSLKLRIDESILKELGERFLAIKKPEGQQLAINLTDLYMNRSIEIDISEVSDSEIMTSSMVYRVNGTDLYQNDPTYTEVFGYEADENEDETKESVSKDYGNDLSHDITITSKKMKNSELYSIKLIIQLNTVYAYSVLEDSNFYYISLKKPTDVYDKVLVVDPGHGGKDVGAIARNNVDYEKDMNLGIALELKKLLDKEDIKVYYTRTKDDTVFLRPRASLANAVDADFFISIHGNSNSLSYPNGTEVLFIDTKVKGVSNKALAGIFSEELSNTIPLRNKGVIERKPEDVFIMGQSQVPMVLLEVGYLSNAGDFNYMIKKDSQKAVAQGIFNGIMRAYEELPAKK